MTSLCSGVTRLKAWVRPIDPIAVGIGQAVQLAAIQAAVAGTEDAQLAADGFGRQPLIAGEHQRAQARGRAGARWSP